MRITSLIENTSNNKDWKAEHGLSLYLETEQRKILFDTGASAAFAENAVKMGVDLAEVDLMILSHGHYDHGGGLKIFLEQNRNARVYMHRDAFGEYYSNKPDGEKKYIGLDRNLLPNSRFCFTEENMPLNDELLLFSGVNGEQFRPSGNEALLVKTKDGYRQDDFVHEQNLLLRENGKMILVAGCAHMGIVNILERCKLLEGRFPDVVIGGFHLYNRSFDTNEDPKIVAAVGKYLLGTGARYYTGHCTGTIPFKQLKTILGERIDYLSTGSQLAI